MVTRSRFERIEDVTIVMPIARQPLQLSEPRSVCKAELHEQRQRPYLSNAPSLFGEALLVKQFHGLDSPRFGGGIWMRAGNQ